MFPAAQAAPCRNPWEFEALRDSGCAYNLYAGHILGGQIDIVEGCDLVTILRHPAEIAVSAYHHHRNSRAPETTSEHEHLDGLHDDIAGLCRQLSMEQVLRRDHPAVRFAFRNTLTRFLGATNAEHFDDASIGGRDAVEVCKQQITIGRRILNRALVVGDYGQYADSLLLIAAERGWPAPPVLPRYHDFGAATCQEATRPEIESAARDLSLADYEIYQFAQPFMATLRSRLVDLCGEATRQAVNARHARLFFAESPALAAFRAEADTGWAGHGWAMREYDGGRNPYRRIADERSAVVLARLAAGPKRFRLQLWNVGDAALQGLQVRVNGAPLARNGLSWEGPVLSVDWALPNERPEDLVLEIVKPAEAAHEPLWVQGCAVLSDD